MKGFKKMDEKEELISTKSLKIAYIFTVLFLFVQSVVELCYHKVSLALFLLTIQTLILIFSQGYYKKKLSTSNNSK